MLVDLCCFGGPLAGGPDEKSPLYRRLNFDESSDAAEPPFLKGSRPNNNNVYGRGSNERVTSGQSVIVRLLPDWNNWSWTISWRSLRG